MVHVARISNLLYANRRQVPHNRERRLVVLAANFSIKKIFLMLILEFVTKAIQEVYLRVTKVFL